MGNYYHAKIKFRRKVLFLIKRERKALNRLVIINKNTLNMTLY